MPESQTNLSWDVLLDLSGPAGARHERLAGALRSAVRDGVLPVGTALPPSRKLATDLGCSRWLVTQAYGQLVAEGYLEARTGAATRVSWSPGRDERRPPAARVAAPVPRYDLAPGVPDLRAFPRRRWADALRDVLTTMPHTEFGVPPLGGHPRLRAVVAEYLRRCRGASAAPRDVTICAGVTEGVTRVCRALAARGVTAVAVEDPSWGRTRQAVAAAGLTVVPVPVDEDGVRVDLLGGTRAVVVTPAHQFPTGTVLAPARRAALVAWARDVDGLVLEDDYDAEFRYDRRPVGTVQGMAPAHVALFGSVSKTLSPALGIGWHVLPPAWTESYQAANPAAATPSVVDQLALAAFIDQGGYDRHLRAVRLRYRSRRDALVAALATHLPDSRTTGVAAGLHLLLHLGGAVDTGALVRRAAAEGLRLVDLAAYRSTPPEEPALVLGYGNLADNAVLPAVALLASLL
ncbi:PLP-dependent aminotransferase family protein [Umezawaea sp. Da 62-37]|uniref:MocR-like pyridoxine biosynthesis transcription factor PdxR n=1 Tax=Umezawaea sp. Da 62-37 TaxID=3075927 RepID=UPI0028F6E647|nr:PLP-dependent aminotransferase family protein [Umezawaea sp. Da 62-37]WNV85954.1 PLP-dependent aminotransferase family protein [Umezawaea sp. Da 62-37]